MKVYKVVKKYSLCSIGGMVQYHVGRWTHTPAKYAKLGLYLTCFETYDLADYFARQYLQNRRSYAIYECEARKVLKPATMRMSQSPQKLAHTIGEHMLYMRWPTGTMMCKAIKLRKQV